MGGRSAALDPRPRRVIPYLVYQSLVVEKADISGPTRSAVLQEARDSAAEGDIRCYCCGDTLWAPSFETSMKNISLDHVWPRTMGGKSTADNLLPVCDPCNGAKQDRASWGVYGVVYDHALVERGSQDDDRLLGLSLHRRAAGALAIAQYLTLKDAFVRLGPRTEVELIDEDAGRHVFNFRAHDEQRFSF